MISLLFTEISMIRLIGYENVFYVSPAHSEILIHRWWNTKLWRKGQWTLELINNDLLVLLKLRNNDKNGIIWHESIAPYEVNIVAIGFNKDEKITKAALSLYEDFLSMGYEVILDDRKDGYGTKMKDAELIGVPMNVIIGKNYIEKKEIELKHRDGQSSIRTLEDIKTIFEHFKNK